MSKLISDDEVEKIRQSGKILAEVIREIKRLIIPGVKTSFLDQVAADLIKSHGARPAFLGYRGYPASICISINEQVVHGIPGERVIESGDLVSVDIGVEFQGFYTDAAFSVVAGDGNSLAQKLVEVTEKSLYEGIKRALPGNRIGDISHAIQETIESAGFSVVRDFVGHGVGRALHEEPQIPNFGKKNRGVVIEEGMVLAIEPMANEGGYQVEILDDDWTVVTKDGGLSAHFEHTVWVTKKGPVILTHSGDKEQ
ncbi:MAG TPA: type I methionyl aminopeptidase [Candidatus Atribacteria bacterium]|jgi:methionyl aminopeptidase|uniref:type I methionyl aminopeptidase n=1 Tax=Candidatus Sordicultor fermentans TaxID=1953203 RepID=UPI0016AE2E94|nr:type I methionyl aminopeptidase [Atribacterota bacterium]NLY06194.1 type I methionyl aminopeptidase [Candidatus Atribacteria bacterium]MDI9607784.1 type I methionyl aminopeptidase [Atribacterota bacterium]HOA98715.1 type I methionyl aminopeptidase [Candidatus Atribacteria bacterium]HOQ50565.1 type I methionyl aminopeptidase [Candidatus Atribacteria bacterium]